MKHRDCEFRDAHHDGFGILVICTSTSKLLTASSELLRL